MLGSVFLIISVLNTPQFLIPFKSMNDCKPNMMAMTLLTGQTKGVRVTCFDTADQSVGIIPPEVLKQMTTPHAPDGERVD